MAIVTGLELDTYVLDWHNSGAGRSMSAKPGVLGGVESKPRERVAEIYVPVRSPLFTCHVRRAPSSPNLHCQA